MALLAIGITIGIAKRNFIRAASVAEGSVVDVRGGGSHPKVEFVAPSGQSIIFPQGGWTFGYRRGERVRVLYDAANPSRDVEGLLQSPGVACHYERRGQRLPVPTVIRDIPR
jgi:hypothetical protein